MTKVDIISGFLGSGKTTLIRKLLSEALQGQKVVLIENEFGEIGIDGGFLKDAGINITEMNSGCICCSLVGDFAEALHKVMEQFTPDRIVIEPSGVGKLSDVRKAVENAQKDCDFEINSLIAVADGSKVKMYMKNFGEFYNDQIGSAGTIILSRTQKMTPEKLDAAVDMIRGKNDQATIITTPWDDLAGAQILAEMEKSVSLADELMAEVEEHHHHHDHEHEHHHHDHDEHCCEHDHEHEHHHHEHDHGHEHHHHDGHCCCGHDHHHADEVFVSWGAETHRKYTEEELRSMITALDEEFDVYGIVLRAKGMLPKEDGTWMYFDMVPEEFELREGTPEVTGKICVIGSGLKAENLNELFHAVGRLSED